MSATHEARCIRNARRLPIFAAFRALAAAALFVAMPAAGSDDRTAATPGPADRWPARAIRLVVPQAAGGTADVVARMLAERLEPALGVPVVVDNRPGANGVIGTDIAKRAAPDGHTLLLASTATHAMAPHAIAAATFDPLRDFAPVVAVAWQTKVVLASTELPVASLADLVAYARERPGKLDYASTGVGSSSHLDTELLAATTGIVLHHVPYRGSGQTIAAVTANEVQVLLASVTASLGAVQAGHVRALAILGDRRSPLLPQVPTLAETGVPPLDVRTWLGLVAPAGTPEPVIATIAREVDRVLAIDAVRRWLDAQGLEPAGGTTAAFDAVIRADVAKWGELARRLGLRVR